MTYRESEGFFSRRSFLATGGGAVAAAALARPGSVFATPTPNPNAMRLALVGTGLEAKVAEARGLRFSFYGLLASVAVIALLTAPPGAPLRDPTTGGIIGATPFMDSLLFVITVIFLIAGICYGMGARTISGSTPGGESLPARSRALWMSGSTRPAATRCGAAATAGTPPCRVSMRTKRTRTTTAPT